MPDLTISIIADVAKAVQGLDQVEKKSTDFGDTLKNTGQLIGSYLALDKIKGWANEWIGAARESGKATRQIGIIFEEEAAHIQTWAKEAANAVGLSATEAKSLTVNIGNQLRGYGLDAREAAEASTALAERAAHVGWVLDKDVSTVLETLGSALRGRTAGLKQMGVNMSTADIEARLLAKGLGELEGKEANAAQATEVLNFFLEQTEHMAGAIKPGGLKELHATTEDLKVTLGEALLPVVNKIIPYLVTIANWAQEHPRLFTAVTLTVVGLAAAFGLAAAASAAFSLAASPILLPLLAIVGALVAITAAVIIVIKNWDTLVGWFRTGWEWMNRVVDGLGYFVFFLGPLGIAIGLVKNFETVWRGVESAVRAVIVAVEWVISKLSGLGGILSRIPGIGGRAIGVYGVPGVSTYGAPALPGFGGLGGGIEINVSVAGNVGDPTVLGRRVVEALRAYVDSSGRRELQAVVLGA